MTGIKPSGSIVHELRRRRVFRTCLYYVLAWIIIYQFGDTIFPALGVSGVHEARHVFFIAMVGFPICFALSWYLEITPRGIVRNTTQVERRVLKNIAPINDRRHDRSSRQSEAEIESRYAWIITATTGPLTGLRFGVEDTLTIGRSLECDLAVVTPHISRRHARLEIDNGTLYVEDLGSASGTTVNGQPVTQRQLLNDEDELAMHDVIFRVNKNPSS